MEPVRDPLGAMYSALGRALISRGIFQPMALPTSEITAAKYPTATTPSPQTREGPPRHDASELPARFEHVAGEARQCRCCARFRRSAMKSSHLTTGSPRCSAGVVSPVPAADSCSAANSVPTRAHQHERCPHGRMRVFGCTFLAERTHLTQTCPSCPASFTVAHFHQSGLGWRR